jgi:hypothetical protein
MESVQNAEIVACYSFGGYLLPDPRSKRSVKKRQILRVVARKGCTKSGGKSINESASKPKDDGLTD